MRRPNPEGLILKVITSVVLMTVLIGLLLEHFTMSAVVATIRAADWKFAMATLVSAMMQGVARALRLGLVVPNLTPLEAFKVTTFHNLANNVLPMKLGEAVLPALLVRSKTVSIGNSVGILALLRGLDIIAIAILFSITLLFWVLPGVSKSIKYAPVVLIGIFALSAFLLRTQYGNSLFRRLQDRRPILFTVVQPTLEALQAWSTIRLLTVLNLTALIWLCSLAACTFALAAIGVSRVVEVGLLATSAAIVSYMLPIAAPANLGTFESAWLVALSASNLTPNSIIASSLLAHAGFLLGAFLMAGVAVAAGALCDRKT